LRRGLFQSGIQSIMHKPFLARPTFSLYIARQTHLYFIDRFISLLFSTFKVFSESTLSADDYWYTTQGSCWSANPNYKYGGSCKRQARSWAQQQRYRKEKLTVIGSRRLSMRSQRLVRHHQNYTWKAQYYYCAGLVSDVWSFSTKKGARK
jgi:hypothetical protein